MKSSGDVMVRTCDGRRRRGFTLVELVLVAVMAAMLAALAVGGLAGIRKWQNINAVRRVQADLLYARAAAQATLRRTLWRFDAGRQAYELLQEPLPASGAIQQNPMTDPSTGVDWVVALNSLSACASGSCRVISEITLSVISWKACWPGSTRSPSSYSLTRHITRLTNSRHESNLASPPGNHCSAKVMKRPRA